MLLLISMIILPPGFRRKGVGVMLTQLYINSNFWTLTNSKLQKWGAEVALYRLVWKSVCLQALENSEGHFLSPLGLL